MKITIEKLTFNIILHPDDLSLKKNPVIFLHGFTGSSLDWQFVFNELPKEFLPVAIDLKGHGESSSPAEIEFYSAESIALQLYKILSNLNLNQIILVGYSMGGRAALSFALKYPAQVKGLILESTTPGISDKDERLKRVSEDELLADKIEKDGIDNFIKYWMNLPLFESLKSIPELEYSKLLSAKKNNNPVGLANCLRGFSTGIMPDYWDLIKKIKIPVMLITGELDEKFTSINSNAEKLFPHAKHEIIKDCGHNTHLEKKEEFVILLKQFLNTLQ